MDTPVPDTPAERARQTLARWLAAAEADAERRGMPELKPLLQGLAASTTALRSADWNDVPHGEPSGEAPAQPESE